jgi:hypothetical protein
MKSKITGNINLGGHHFEYEVYFPRNSHDINEKDEIARRLGSRIKNGAVCLGLDETLARTHITNNEYVAVGFIKNKHHDDVASGTLQYFDWCDHRRPEAEKRGKQIWINDLCRITKGNKPDQSPVKALLQLFETVTRVHLKLGLSYIHLMVENKDVSSNISKDASILVNIYKKYGFAVVSPSECHVQDKYIIMKKRIGHHGGGKKQTLKKRLGRRKSLRKKKKIQ